jgi:hypothetical protein
VSGLLVRFERRVQRGLGALRWARVVLVILIAAILTGTATAARNHPAPQVAPQATTAPTPAPPGEEAWLAIMEQSRAALPDSVSDFYALGGLMALAPQPEGLGSVEERLSQNPRPLGTVTVLSGPTPCDGEICYDTQVSCPQLAQSATATLKIGDPQGTLQGTILFASGWDGTYWWGGPGTNYGTIVNQLQAVGFRTVQIRWHTNWWAGASGQLEGYAKLACRPATVLRWVYDNLRQDVHAPFCAEGHSNGASQVAYAITQYGLADLFSLVLFESGPNFARVDHGCIEDTSDPGNLALFYTQSSGRGLINWSLGLPQDSGACVDQDEAYRSLFEEISLAFDDNWQYYYPSTMAAFVFGENDLGTTAIHGLYYHNRLVQAGSPLVRMDVIDGADHFVADTREGMDAISDILVNECVVRPTLHVAYLPVVVRP